MYFHEDDQQVHYKSMHMPSRLHPIIAFTVKGRHVDRHVDLGTVEWDTTRSGTVGVGH